MAIEFDRLLYGRFDEGRVRNEKYNNDSSTQPTVEWWMIGARRLTPTCSKVCRAVLETINRVGTISSGFTTAGVRTHTTTTKSQKLGPTVGSDHLLLFTASMSRVTGRVVCNVDECARALEQALEAMKPPLDVFAGILRLIGGFVSYGERNQLVDRTQELSGLV